MSRRLIVNVSHFTHTVYSGAPFNIIVEGRGTPHNEERDYGTFLMPETVWQPRDVGFGDAVQEQIRFDGLPVKRGGERLKAPDHLKESGEHHAWALIDRDPKWSNLGVFVADHVTGPTKEEIFQATARYRIFMRKEYARGVAVWNQFRQPHRIDDRCKAAALLFKEKTEWAVSAVEDTMPCPNCQELVPIKLVFHKSCGAVIDAEKAQELHVGPYAPVAASAAGLAAAAQATLSDTGLDE